MNTRNLQLRVPRLSPPRDPSVSETLARDSSESQFRDQTVKSRTLESG